jgi:hypothetical protein
VFVCGRDDGEVCVVAFEGAGEGVVDWGGGVDGEGGGGVEVFDDGLLGGLVGGGVEGGGSMEWERGRERERGSGEREGEGEGERYGEG